MRRECILIYTLRGKVLGSAIRPIHKNIKQEMGLEW